jgi:hypothetical protein
MNDTTNNNTIYKYSSFFFKIENFSRISKLDTNQVMCKRYINFKVNKDAFVSKGQSGSGKFALLDIIKALEKWICLYQRWSNRKRDY